MKYTGQGFFKKSVEGRTQADGAFEVDVLQSLYVKNGGRGVWGIQLVINGSPTSGTLTVKGKLPGAPSFTEIADPIDMVNGPFLIGLDKPIGEFQFIPSDFDGDSFSIYLCAV